MQITSKQGQWLGDIAVREAGSIEAMIEMSVKSGRSITDTLTVGTQLDTPTPIDKRTMTYYAINGIYPATDVGVEIVGGIEYMGIEIDFLVN